MELGAHSKWSVLVIAPVRKPRPRGEKGTMAMPSRLQVGITLSCSQAGGLAHASLRSISSFQDTAAEQWGACSQTPGKRVSIQQPCM